MGQFSDKDPDFPRQREFLNKLAQRMRIVAMEPREDTMMPTIGRTDRKIFWLVLMVSLLVLTGMMSLVSKGAIAMAAAVPVPFTIQAGTLNGKNFHLYPGVSQADNNTPVAVNQMDCTITNLVITKQITLPVVGTVTVKMSAGSNTPANLTGLTTDVAALGTSSTSFQNLSINTGPNSLDLTAPSAILNNANISSPYLLVSSITLPGLSVSITH